MGGPTEALLRDGATGSPVDQAKGDGAGLIEHAAGEGVRGGPTPGGVLTASAESMGFEISYTEVVLVLLLCFGVGLVPQ